MSNPSQWVLVKRVSGVTGYSTNAARHKVKNATSVGNSFTVFDAPESRERYQQGGAA